MAEDNLLKESAINSIRLAIELFNRPSERGRRESVLILLNHAFEMLLKAGLSHRGVSVWEGGIGQTIGFERCVNLAHLGDPDTPDIKFLGEEDATTIRAINAQRDAASHYVVDLDESHLYIHARAGITVFDRILETVFGDRLADHLPERILPLSTRPPERLDLLIGREYYQVRALLKRGDTAMARAKLMALESLDRAANEEHRPPRKKDLEAKAEMVAEGKRWADVFPGVAALNLRTEGEGPSLKVQITKGEGMPVRLVPTEELTGEETVVGLKRVNELDYYSLGIKKLAEKLPITWPKAKAVAESLALTDDEEYYKEIRVGSATYKRYSPAALERIQEALISGEVDPGRAWEEHGW